MHRFYQIAIDGPCGVGKSTIANNIAKKLNFTYINTGAMYRCYALNLLNNNIDINDTNAILKTIKKSNIELNGNKYFLNGKDVTKDISNANISILSSKIATINEVRKICVSLQQKIAQGINCVMEGRDIGSIVLPNATLKVYLDANIDLRAKRRWLQMNKNESFDSVKEKIIERDNKDKNREISPLVRLPEAFYVYDHGQSINEISNLIIEKFKEIINE